MHCTTNVHFSLRSNDKFSNMHVKDFKEVWATQGRKGLGGDDALGRVVGGVTGGWGEGVVIGWLGKVRLKQSENLTNGLQNHFEQMDEPHFCPDLWRKRNRLVVKWGDWGNKNISSHLLIKTLQLAETSFSLVHSTRNSHFWYVDGLQTTNFLDNIVQNSRWLTSHFTCDLTHWLTEARIAAITTDSTECAHWSTYQHSHPKTLCLKIIHIEIIIFFILNLFHILATNKRKENY